MKSKTIGCIIKTVSRGYSTVDMMTVVNFGGYSLWNVNGKDSDDIDFYAMFLYAKSETT